MNLSRRTVTLLAGALVAGCGVQERSITPTAARASARVLPLPPPRTDGTTSLEQALARRHSVRRFTGQALETGQLGQLMWAAQGVTHLGNRRTAPSGGALYPLELYAVSRTRVLHYLPHGHRAEEWLTTEAWPGLVGATPSKDAVEAAPAAFVLTGVTRRTAAKYGGQSQTYVTLEAGHAAENLCLQAVTLGLGSVVIGAVNPGKLARTLALAIGEVAYYIIPVGFPAPGA